jgi:hypothetical protein
MVLCFSNTKRLRQTSNHTKKTTQRKDRRLLLPYVVISLRSQNHDSWRSSVNHLIQLHMTILPSFPIKQQPARDMHGFPSGVLRMRSIHYTFQNLKTFTISHFHKSSKDQESLEGNQMFNSHDMSKGPYSVSSTFS